MQEGNPLLLPGSNPPLHRSLSMAAGNTILFLRFALSDGSPLLGYHLRDPVMDFEQIFHSVGRQNVSSPFFSHIIIEKFFSRGNF
jgi:hypothetical protein